MKNVIITFRTEERKKKLLTALAKQDPRDGTLSRLLERLTDSYIKRKEGAK